MREKIVMVTGASGEVGQALVRQLVEEDGQAGPDAGSESFSAQVYDGTD